MTNKVGGFENRPVQVGTDRAVKRSSSGTSAPTSTSVDTAPSTGSVQITDSARQLAALEAAIKDLPAVDEAKVAELRNAIDGGTYEVNAGRVADKLLRSDQELHDAGTQSSG